MIQVARTTKTNYARRKVYKYQQVSDNAINSQVTRNESRARCLNLSKQRRHYIVNSRFDCEMETGSRKRLRRSKDVDSVDSSEVLGNPGSDAPNIIGIPPSLEARFATAVFELGLKQSSPKIIMVILEAVLKSYF
jgi:hypothetical protein